MAIPLILDTDIGTDVDDCLALAVILASPEIDLLGVTCVYGDVLLRARMVMKLLALADRSDVPVMVGAEQPFLGLRPVYWPGHEGVGVLESGDDALTPNSEHAVDVLIRTVMDRPGEIHLLAIGPLTNVALALKREPRLAGALGHLTIMGGALRGLDRLDLAIAEHNIRCDPEAAHIVFASGAPMTLIPLDVTTRVAIRRDDVTRIRAVGTRFHMAVADQVERYPRFGASGSTLLHDPLAAAVVIQPALVTVVPLHVAVETQGRLTAGMTVATLPTEEFPATARVGVEIDPAAAEGFILNRITSARSLGATVSAGR